MIKGHAVIELKDVATGEVQRVEHDNMITNGLKYCLTPWLGKFSYATDGSTPQVAMNESTETRKSNNRSIMNHLLSGIFLFQNNLEENVDNTAFPLDNPLTGKASWDTYSGMDTYRGSYNENESGLQDDGSYKHVWDFSTDQANGQISALALTTYKGGICGCGFKEWDSVKETAIMETPFFELGQIGIDGKNKGAECTPIIKASSNEIFYVPDRWCLSYDTAHADRYLGSGKLFLKKKKFPLSRLSPFYDYYNQYYTEDIEIDVPEEFAAYANKEICSGRTSDNYLYIYKNTNIKAQEALKIMRIKKSDLEIDIITLINNSPYILKTQDMQFTDDFCFLKNNISPYCTYRINMADNEINEIIKLERDYNLQKIGDYIYAGQSGTSTSKDTYCINPETMEVKYHPFFKTDESRWWYGSTEKLAPNIYLKFEHYYYASNSDLDAVKVYISANTLMTINNLPSPVVKTAAQTMKVTYTIQETEQ